MNEDREAQAAGAPVEETEASRTDVLAAVERAKGNDESVAGDPNAAVPVTPMPGAAAQDPADGVATHSANASEAPGNAGSPAGSGVVTSASGAPVAPESANHETAVGLETQPHIERPVVTERQEMPSAGTTGTDGTPAPITEAAAQPQPSTGPPVRDGEIRIDSDHPMAALYMQTPMPPELRGNRGAGVLIALLATVVFAAVYAGVIALRLAPVYPPSTFLTDGLLPYLVSWGFIGATVAFFIGLMLVVLIVGRAGWWAYVLGGFPIGLLVWAGAIVGYAFSDGVLGGPTTSWAILDLVRDFALTLPTLGAAVVAREVSIWFGAWIGARGRKMTAKNAELLDEYETALAEVRSKQS
ncbi:MAG: hypothetical protein ACTHZ9_10085 [Leucobacter sp.]